MHVPGYAGVERVPALGGAWRARDAATGEPVLLRFVAAPPARLRPVRALDVAGLLPVRHVAAVAGGCVVVYDFRPSAVVDAATRSALAETLHCVHRAGFTHGALDATYVFAGPLLGGVGLAEAVGEIVDPADDLQALQSLRDVASEPAPTHRRRFPAVTVALAVIAFVATVLLASRGNAGSRPDWKAVLSRLDALRVQAFETGDLATLQRADVGLALQRDTVTLQRVRGHRLTGLHFTIRSISGPPNKLLVTDVMSSYQLEGHSVVGRPPAQWVILLQQHARNDWRIARVEVARTDRNLRATDR